VTQALTPDALPVLAEVSDQALAETLAETGLRYSTDTRRGLTRRRHDLFQYLDEAGQRHTVSSSAINVYLREISGFDFTAKD